MQLFKLSSRHAYDRIMRSIGQVVSKLDVAIGDEKIDDIFNLIRQNREYLQELSQESGICLETSELKRICDDEESRESTAKFSGAGGGDCAIVVFKKDLPEANIPS